MSSRPRWMYKFWLQLDKPEEEELSRKLEIVRKSRKFAPTMRTALRLFFSLMEGRTDVVLELFPWIREALHDAPERQNLSENGNSNVIASKDDTDALKAHIERLEQLILEKGNVPILQGKAPIKTIPSPKKYTEPVLEVTKATYTENANFNMLIS